MNTECEYKNYGRCARFERNGLIAMVTLDVGPRIIYYGSEDFNFLNEDLERNVSKDGAYFDENFKIGEKWFLYGGHRVWKSPEDLESYTPDNYAVDVEYTRNGGRFTGRAAKNFDYSIELEMDSDGSVRIVNTIENKSDKARELSVWALTVAAKGGVLVVPLNEPHDDLNPSQNLVQWPYNDLADERVYFGKKYLAVCQTSKPEAVKLGVFTEKRRAYYVIGNKALKFEYGDGDGAYGDFHCNFETYTNKHILEVEGLSPRSVLKKGERASLCERWSIVDCAPVDNVSDDALSSFI